MNRIFKLAARAKHLFKNDSLFRNAALLMASTAVMSVLGFVFWVFIAHLYSPDKIGEASALISVTVLVSSISLIGLNSGLVRFLPKSRDQSGDVNAAMATVAILTMLVAVAYLLISVPLKIHIPLLDSKWHKAAFIVLMSTISLNSITDAVFIANRKAELHTAGYTILGLVKLVLPLFLVPFGSLGIFLAYIIAVIASLFASFIFMWKFCNYKFKARPQWNLLSRTRNYATNNYLGGILGGIPSQIMPLLIIRRLGSADVAYFAMAWTMANLLYVIPTGATQSLLAESSNNPDKKTLHVKYTVSLLTKILVPVVTISILIAPYFLEVFGKEYSRGSTVIFQLFAFSTIFLAINAVIGTILNIEHRSSGIVISQAVALVVTFASAAFMINDGLTGVGVSMLVGTIASSLALFGIYKFHKLRDKNFFKMEVVSIGNVPINALSTSTAKKLLATYGINKFTYQLQGNSSNDNIYLIKQKNNYKILKIYPSDKITKDNIGKEVEFIQFLYNKHIPVPQLIHNKRKELVSQAIVNGSTVQYVLMEFEPGFHPDKYSKRVLEHMANNQAKMHIYGHEFAKSLGSDKTDRNVFQTQVLNLIVNPSSLLYFAPKGYSHFDFDASNILVKDNKITCILDFEGSRLGPLVSCIYFTLTRIYDSQKDATHIESYLSSYQKVRKLNVIEKSILRFALLIKYKNPKLLFVYN